MSPKMYLNEVVKGFESEGPTFVLFMIFFFNLQKGKGPFI